MAKFIIIFLLIYSVLIEPNILYVKKLTFKNQNIKNLKIVFVSDFHLSKLSKGKLDRIINKVNEQNADIILSGGDYLSAHSKEKTMDMDIAAKKLSQMKSKYGIYSVHGNHDYFKDGEYVKENLRNNGIKVLENSNVEIKHNTPFYLAGISDMQTTRVDLNKALRGAERPIILLSHSPDITPYAKEHVDLILSGHTHGGQIRIPFFGAIIVPSQFGKKYETGFVDKIVYVSKGLGTSIIKARFNCFPEITVINFE